MQSPSFDTWTIVFLIAAVQGFFIALVLWRLRSAHSAQRLANRLLAVLVSLFAFTLVEYVLYWTRYIYRFPHVAEASAQLPFLFGPLLWWYWRSIYEGKGLRRRDLWHLVPFMTAVILASPWYLLDAATKQAVIINKHPFPVSMRIVQVILWLRIAHLVCYAVWNTVYLRRQPAIGDMRKWARLLQAFFIGFILAYASYFVLVRFPFFNSSWDYHISAAMTAFIYLIAYAGYLQPAVFQGFLLSEAALPAKYRNSGLTPEASRSLLQKLDQLMETERLYRDANLSLDTLAARLGASKHHVSQVINAHRNNNFFEYLNQLRVEEARRLLAETTREDLHVIEIAYAVGFNNKVSFNTAFKKSTGMTPTAYRRSHGSSDVGEPGEESGANLTG